MTGAAASAVWIAAGGAAGSVARYLLSVGVQRAAAAASSPRGHGLFPFGTLTVNVLGSLAIGFLSVRLLQGAAIAPHHRLGILVGVLGGFTTFSIFSYETVQMLEDGQVARATLNVVGSVLLCLGACWCGLRLARGMG